jgi:hypothetical protein
MLRTSKDKIDGQAEFYSLILAALVRFRT